MICKFLPWDVHWKGIGTQIEYQFDFEVCTFLRILTETPYYFIFVQYWDQGIFFTDFYFYIVQMQFTAKIEFLTAFFSAHRCLLETVI